MSKYGVEYEKDQRPYDAHAGHGRHADEEAESDRPKNFLDDGAVRGWLAIYTPEQKERMLIHVFLAAEFLTNQVRKKSFSLFESPLLEIVNYSKFQYSETTHVVWLIEHVTP